MQTYHHNVNSPQESLQYFPVTLFASVMGLCGLSIAYRHFEDLFALKIGASISLLIIAYSVFLLVSGTYLLKLWKHSATVHEEFNHPVRANFFPAISISLMLLSAGTLTYIPSLARYLWFSGAALHFIFTIIIMSRWINRDYDITHANPAWFIPVVGNIVAPIAGVEFAHRELAWFLFSIGCFFWMVLFTVLFYRIVFHRQIAEKMLPTLFIMIAPPSLGFISYVRITEQVDGFARVLLYVALFFVILLLLMANTFTRLNFFVSWWAYTFPLCAVTIATMLAFKFLGVQFLGWVAVALLLLTSCIIAIVAAKTVHALIQNKVCVPET